MAQAALKTVAEAGALERELGAALDPAPLRQQLSLGALRSMLQAQERLVPEVLARAAALKAQLSSSSSSAGRPSSPAAVVPSGGFSHPHVLWVVYTEERSEPLTLATLLPGSTVAHLNRRFLGTQAPSADSPAQLTRLAQRLEASARGPGAGGERS